MPEYRLTKPLVRQVFLFLLVGALCYVISILLLMFFVELLQMEVNLANAISSVIVIFICYLLNVKFVFKGGRYSRKKEIVAFFTLSLVGFLLNVALMFLMTKYLAIWYVVSKTVVTLIVAVLILFPGKSLSF